MGKKNDNKQQTAKTVAAVKQLLGGFTKQQIAEIQKELEEGGSDEEPSSFITTAPIPDDYWYLPTMKDYRPKLQVMHIPNNPTVTWSKTYYTTSTANYVPVSDWLPLNPQKREIEEDVQDVDFSEE